MECALLITCIIYCIFHSSNGNIMGINISLAHINVYMFPSAYILWPQGFSLEVWKPPPLKHRCFVFSFFLFVFCLLDFKVGACACHERGACLRPYCRWVCWRCGGHLEGQLASDLQRAVIYLNLIFILLRGLQWPLTPGLSITSTPCIGVPLSSCSSEAS